MVNSLSKLLLAGSPLIAAVLTQIGIHVTEEQVSAWINLMIWVIALLVFIAPSFRAWLNHRELAE